MNHFFKTISSTVVVAVLVACGGGGGDEVAAPAPEPEPIVVEPAPKYSQADIKSVAGLGLNAAVFGSSHNIFALSYLSSFLLAFSNNNTSGSATAVVQSCTQPGSTTGGGSRTMTLTKSAAHPGLFAGEKLTVVYENCQHTDSEYVLNGVVDFIPIDPVPAATYENYEIKYEIKFTQFSILNGANIDGFDGLANINVKVIDFNDFTQKMAVPFGHTLKISNQGSSIDYKSGASLITNSVIEPNSASFKLDGDVAFTNVGQTNMLSISMPTMVSGIDDVNGLIATSGVINIKDTNLNLATSITFNTTEAVVRGDTDGNASLDLVCKSTWEELSATP
jgi:hypothetical protein